MSYQSSNKIAVLAAVVVFLLMTLFEIITLKFSVVRQDEIESLVETVEQKYLSFDEIEKLIECKIESRHRRTMSDGTVFPAVKGECDVNEK